MSGLRANAPEGKIERDHPFKISDARLDAECNGTHLIPGIIIKRHSRRNMKKEHLFHTTNAKDRGILMSSLA
jgi:hypothetical protein